MTTCGHCRRTLLTGERFRLFRLSPAADVRSATASHERVAVCVLCDPSARALGWQGDGGDVRRENAVGERPTVRLVA